jgi:hypothetical protein
MAAGPKRGSEFSSGRKVLTDKDRKHHDWTTACELLFVATSARQRLGLKAHDLHITLGFLGADVFDVPKVS